MEPVQYAKFHAPIFVNGKNHGDSITATRDLQMLFDDVGRQMLIKWNGKVGVIPEAAINTWMPLDQDKFLKEFQLEIIPPKPKRTHIAHAQKLDIQGAQVSDPSTQVQNPRKDLKQ